AARDLSVAVRTRGPSAARTALPARRPDRGCDRRIEDLDLERRPDRRPSDARASLHSIQELRRCAQRASDGPDPRGLERRGATPARHAPGAVNFFARDAKNGEHTIRSVLQSPHHYWFEQTVVCELHRAANSRYPGRDNGAAHVLLEGHNQ